MFPFPLRSASFPSFPGPQEPETQSVSMSQYPTRAGSSDLSARDFFGTHPEFVENRFGPPLVTKHASGENSHVPVTDPEETTSEGREGSAR